MATFRELASVYGAFVRAFLNHGMQRMIVLSRCFRGEVESVSRLPRALRQRMRNSAAVRLEKLQLQLLRTLTASLLPATFAALRVRLRFQRIIVAA